MTEIGHLPDATAVVDARGLRCPLPVIRLAQRARDGGRGEVLEVWATDPAAAADVPAWARLRGHDYLGSRPGDPADGASWTAYLVRLTDPGPGGRG